MCMLLIWECVQIINVIDHSVNVLYCNYKCCWSQSVVIENNNVIIVTFYEHTTLINKFDSV